MNKWFSPKSFMDLIERYNPFGYKKEDGETCTFRTYKDAYLYSFKQLYLMFPRGYLDLVLFVSQQTKMPHADSVRIVKTWKSLEVTDVMLVDLRTNDNARKFDLMRIIKALHTISETRFNEAMFSEALVDFDLWLELEENKKLIEIVENDGQD